MRILIVGGTSSLAQALKPVLSEFAKSGASKRVRNAAVSALGQIGSDKAKAALLDILGVKGKEE